MKLYAYKQGSASAKALADALGIKRLKHEGKPLLIKDTLINWGGSAIKRAVIYQDTKVLNWPASVAKAANKLETFKALSEAGVSVPDWTNDSKEALEHFKGESIVVRHKLNGHSGEGIEIIEPLQNLPMNAPLYTKYIKKKEEYRIHVFQGEAFFVQRKARKLDVPDEEVNWKVRNLAGGFIFANKEVEVADVAKREAIAAVHALGLDFGAVDIILGTDKNWYVLEVNTACGLEGTTLEKYVEQFQKYL